MRYAHEPDHPSELRDLQRTHEVLASRYNDLFHLSRHERGTMKSEKRFINTCLYPLDLEQLLAQVERPENLSEETARLYLTQLLTHFRREYASIGASDDHHP
jgi:hypothetical protein